LTRFAFKHSAREKVSFRGKSAEQNHVTLDRSDDVIHANTKSETLAEKRIRFSTHFPFEDLKNISRDICRHFSGEKALVFERISRLKDKPLQRLVGVEAKGVELALVLREFELKLEPKARDTRVEF
jgi:hypothetical protein